MKRKIIRVIFLVLTLLVLPGCGNDSEKTSFVDNNSEVTEENYTRFPVSDASIFTIVQVDGGIEISKVDKTAKDKVIVVPETINGQKVVSIGSGAFLGVKAEAIVLPDTVERLGFSPFNSLEFVEYIYLGKGIKTLGDMTFNLCNRLKKIELPEGTEKIGNYLVLYCPLLEEIIIPASVNDIYKLADNTDFKGVIKTPAGSYAEQKAIAEGLNVVNY